MSGHLELLNLFHGLPAGILDLENGRYLLGRSSSCDIIVEDPSVSRMHAEIVIENTTIIVVDQGSSNGTFVDETKVDRCQVTPGQRLRVGNVSFLLNPAPDEADLDEEEVKTEKCLSELDVLAAPPGISALSGPERRTYQCMLHGWSEMQIARHLELSKNTVHSHVQAIYRAFGVHTYPELLARCRPLPARGQLLARIL